MGRLSYIPFAGTVTNANGDVDLVEVLPGDDKPVAVVAFCLGQTSEVGDTQEESLDIRLVHMNGTITGGSGGSAGAPFYPDFADDALTEGFSAETMNTTIATTSGSSRELRFPWNLRGTPYVERFPDPRERIKARQTEGLFLRLATAVTDDVAIAGWLLVEED